MYKVGDIVKEGNRIGKVIAIHSKGTADVLFEGMEYAIRRQERNLRKVNPRVSAFDDIEPTSQYYPTIFGDYDGDGIYDVDDPMPYIYDPNAGTVEEIKLSDEIRQLIEYRQEMNQLKKNLLLKLKKLGAEYAYGRTKTPFSLINKLRRKRLTGQQGLTDVVGTTLVARDGIHLQELLQKIQGGELGVITEFKDYYKKPKEGYRAYHFILYVEGVPVEIQLKTVRQALLGDVSHTLYKEGKKDAQMHLQLTDLAHLADLGDKPAMAEFKRLSRNREHLYQLMKEK